MKKKIVLPIVCSVIILSVAICFVMATSFGLLYKIDGIQKIRVSSSGSDKITLKFNYFGSHGYKVELVDPDENINARYAEKVSFNENLGKYRIRITFMDTDVRDKALEQYRDPVADGVYVLKGVPQNLENKLRICFSYPDDSQFVIYIGSDEPLQVEDQDFINLDHRPIGTVRVLITVGTAN